MCLVLRVKKGMPYESDELGNRAMDVFLPTTLLFTMLGVWL